MENNATNHDEQANVQNTLTPNDHLMDHADPIALDISDEKLVQVVEGRIDASKKWFDEKYNLTNRRQKNEKYLFGRQVDDAIKQKKLKDYETRSADNALYEIESSLKPLAMSKLPDIIVTPGQEDPEREASAKDLSTAIDTQNKKREQREVLGLAFKHLPTYFTAIIKARWDSEKGKHGDYRFDIIHPEYVVVDHTAVSRNPDDMSFIAQCVPMTVKDVLMKFPSKKKEFLEALKLDSVLSGNEPTDHDLASEIKIWEVWFDWYKKTGEKADGMIMTKTEAHDASILEPGLTWKRVSGVLWQCQGVLLKKCLDPNYDFEGEEKLFAYPDPSDESTKKEVSYEDVVKTQLVGEPLPDIRPEQVYHNYFDRPHKPYYFMGYDQWGKVYIDETSRIEQNIRNQENLDDQNKTVIDQLKTRIKHIWSKEGGLDKSAVQRLDMDDPRMDALVDGDPNKVHKAILPERPDQAQFNALSDTRDRMYAISGSTAVRGQIQSDTATTNQIAREADFTRTDDLVEDTINAACEWMAQWQMQFIKLRYTEEHLRQILGDKGKMTYIKLRRDMISDGMEVMIKASSTDKLKAQRNAMQTAGLGPPFTNPLDFFRDMDMNDPEGRTERGVMFAMDLAGYFTKYALGLSSAQQMAIGIGQPPAPMGPQQPMPNQPMGQPAPQAGGQLPSPQDTSNVASAPPQIPPTGSPRAL